LRVTLHGAAAPPRTHRGVPTQLTDDALPVANTGRILCSATWTAPNVGRRIPAGAWAVRSGSEGRPPYVSHLRTRLRDQRGV